MKTINIGVIGWGFMGKTHTQALRSIPLFYPDCGFEINLKCICTRRIEKAQEAMRAAGFERCCTDYRELLAMDDIDVVSICTPNDRHEEMAIAAAQAGKHIYLDKPIAVTGESATRIAEACEKAGVFTRSVFHNRYYPATLRAKQLIDEGRIGRIMHFEARYLHSGSIDPNKPIGWKQQMQGGVLLDMGSHVLDLMTWLIGYPKKVFCRTRTLYPERPTRDGGIEKNLSDDHVMMLLELPCGAIGNIEASKIATGSNDDLIFEIRGDKGALRWNLMDPNYLDFYDATTPDKPIGGLRGFTRIETAARYPAPGGAFLPPKNTLGWDRGHMHCYFTFLDDIARGRRSENTVSDGAKLQRLMDKMFESDKAGCWVEAEC
ncbi:MAG: Gfo/Idh/MocA family oxidoreductase [Clostridia bacterium]|nr:Gfo/Idh/MocA family oxidoreductase [Clostridia bacterium]